MPKKTRKRRFPDTETASGKDKLTKNLRHAAVIAVVFRDIIGTRLYGIGRIFHGGTDGSGSANGGVLVSRDTNSTLIIFIGAVLIVTMICGTVFYLYLTRDKQQGRRPRGGNDDDDDDDDDYV